MDLLFKRYASPLTLLNELILMKSLSAYIDDLFTFIAEDIKEKTKWEFFLHKIYDESWEEFCARIEISNDTKKIDMGETLMKSKNILTNFTPD